MKRVIIVLLSLFSLLSIDSIIAKEKADTVKSKSAFKELFSKKYKRAEGMFTMYMMDGKVYIEIPDSLYGRDMLLGSSIAATSDNKNGEVGRKPNDLIHFTFIKESNKVSMRLIESKHIISNVERNNGAIFKLFKIECANDSTKNSIIDVTDLFLSDIKDLSPFYEYSSYASSYKRSESFDKSNSYISNIKSFSDNVSVESLLSYKFTLKGKGSKYEKVPFSASVVRTILLLPKKAVKPRIIDSRIAIFPLDKLTYKESDQGSSKLYYANRWSVVPSDIEAYNRGELVNPTKQIVFYVDPTFPSKYRKYIKEGIEQWNETFEEIGFKNVMVAKDFPTDDPDFDPDNLKYSCVRYAPLSIQNAEGPSWVDPRSGEIINASVHLYHDVLELINNWLFVQTSQVDKRVRKVIIDEEIIGDALRYVVSHEVGHCLGFMHNMSASANVPVDSLRSATYTQKYGTTTSIMDYARFNYVAQPEDSAKGLKLMPPHFGQYDKFLINWNYKYYGDISAEDEYKILSKIIQDSSANPIYRYGKQQFGVLDPRSQTEDLGDDAIKASTYGIKNLKFILKNMDKWLEDGDENYTHRKMIYTEIISQYCRYISHVYYIVGGINLYESHVGDHISNYISIPRERQIEALNFVLNSIDDLAWLYPTDISSKYYIDNPYKDYLFEYVMKFVMDAPSRCDYIFSLSKDPFTPIECMDVIFNKVWGKLKENKPLSVMDMKVQIYYLENLTKKAGIEEFSSGSSSVKAYDEQGALYNENTLMPGDIYTYVLKAKKLLERGAKSRDERTKSHCKSILFKLERGL